MPGGRCGKPNNLPFGGALLDFSCNEGACFARSPEPSSTACVSIDRPRGLRVHTGGLLGPLDRLGDATPDRLEGEGVLFCSFFPPITMLSSATAADATAISIISAFCATTKHGQKLTSLDFGSYARIFHQTLAKMKLSHIGFTPHSPRAGWATQLRLQGMAF